MLLGNHSALESLDALTLAFLDADRHTHGIAHVELGLVLFDHALGDNLHCVHGYSSKFCDVHSRTLGRGPSVFNACCINPAGWSQRILTLQYHTTKKLRMQAIFGILFCFFAFPTLCSNEIHLLKILTFCG